MAKDILPDDARERRRRGRLCALRAVDRLGLLGEGGLLATLRTRPRLRWLADEEGARWAVLAQLGRIGDLGAFEQAVEWALQNRPRPEEAAAYVGRLRSGAGRSASSYGTWEGGAERLGSFFHAPSADERGTKVARAVGPALVMGE
jgi:hypothetical protein